jgi:sterol desaturase/sphingolipid hydroxylase (fatty acid hydroxylase superfamily)
MPSTIISTLDTIGTSIAAIGIILFPLELWRRWRRHQLSKAVVFEMLASASPFLVTALTATITTAFILKTWTWVEHITPWQIANNPLTAPFALLLVDLLYYVDHRAGHRIRMYWAISHSVHHSSPQFDQTTALRVSFIDGFISPLFYLPAIAVGFSPLLIASCFGFILLYQQWLHTELIGKLPWLDSWLNTPSNHRVHHATQSIYLDKNYGAFLMIWDRLLGTYQAENDDIPVHYGLTNPIASRNPITVHISEARRMFARLAHMRTFRQAGRFLVQSPAEDDSQ